MTSLLGIDFTIIEHTKLVCMSLIRPPLTVMVLLLLSCGIAEENNIRHDSSKWSTVECMVNNVVCVFLQKECQKKFEEEAFPKFADYFNKRKELFGKGGYIVGSKVYMAKNRT